jgi:hypothetical protein
MGNGSRQYDWFDDDVRKSQRDVRIKVVPLNPSSAIKIIKQEQLSTLESQAASIPYHHQLYAHFELELENFLCRATKFLRRIKI